jgi:Skp family chaperone for outer membrane proteins
VREYAGKKVKTALAISIIVSIAAMIFAGLVEKRYRQTTQGEVTQIVKRIEAERDAWQRRYETGQETWDGERKKLEATINSTRRAREAAEEKAEGLARENATLRAKLASREESR